MKTSDYFLLLGESRRPWIDPDALKKRFLELSAEAHPDRTHQASKSEQQQANTRFAALNEAYNRLREPKERLAHLLTLEHGQPLSDVQRIPPGTMDLFMAVGECCREVDTHLVEKEAASSPMLRVKLFEQGLEWTDRLQELQAKVEGRRAELDRALMELNTIWAKAPACGSGDRAEVLPLERLEQIYRVYSYVSRWSQQIQERLARLAM